MSAKVVVAILIVAAILGAIGTAVASSSGNDSAVERDLQEQVASLTVERDDSLGELASIDAELAAVQQQLLDAQAGGDDLSATISDLEVQIETLSDQRTAALADVAALTATVAELEGDIVSLDLRGDMLDAALQTANDSAAAAIAARDELANLFPMNFDGSLANANLIGDRKVALTQLYSSGLTKPKIDKLTISRTAVGNLRLNIPGYVEGGLFSAGGALHLVAESTTAVPASNGVARPAQVTITLFPAGYRITDDGARAVVGANGVMTIDAPGGLAFYSIEVR